MHFEFHLAHTFTATQISSDASAVMTLGAHAIRHCCSLHEHVACAQAHEHAVRAQTPLNTAAHDFQRHDPSTQVHVPDMMSYGYAWLHSPSPVMRRKHHTHAAQQHAQYSAHQAAGSGNGPESNESESPAVPLAGSAALRHACSAPPAGVSSGWCADGAS